MIGRRSIAGLSLLCALFLCAVAASSAFAVKGTTAFKCAKVEKAAEFSDAHCTKASTGAGYKHEVIAAGVKTTIVVSNKNTESETTKATPGIIKFRIGPMDGELRCATVSGSGSLTNNGSVPMNVSGSLTTTFSECQVLPEVTFPLCQLEGSGVTTEATLSTPTEGMKVLFTGPEPGIFAKFTLVKCKNSAENASYQVTGSYSAIPNGATWETTTENSLGLKTSGGQAGVVSKTTVTVAPSEPGIAMTTTEP